MNNAKAQIDFTTKFDQFIKLGDKVTSECGGIAPPAHN